jgi:NAD(P)-dependent dehydrogenase (short-subunit alcohol dehydrogenase family)
VLVRAAGGGDAVFVQTDVSDAAQIFAAVGTTTERFGRLDCAVNAAAIENESAPLHECADDLFDRMQQVNLRGTFLSMKHEIGAMLAPGNEGRGGAIVNIASTNSFRPQRDQPAYTASKHAVIGITRSAAIDYARHGIRINAICPGSIDTPMLRRAMERRGRNADEVVGRLSLIGRFGTPDEIAAAALWLCSDAASFVYGHPLAVDAGYLAS